MPLGWRLPALLLLLTLAGAGCTAARSSAVRPAASASPSPPASTERPAAPASPSSARPLTSPPSVHPSLAGSPTSGGPRPPAVPAVSAKAHAAGLVDIRTVVPDAIIDLRYTTSDNFVGVRLYPSDARCLVHQSMAAGLTVAASRLRRAGYRLVFWDCYRPHAVQVRMFQIVPNPSWVARPGPYATSHESARSVDVSLARTSAGYRCAAGQQVRRRCLLDMGTGFDDFTARAHAYATAGLSQQEQANRALLRVAMDAGGITVYSGEWWHFDGPGAKVRRPQLDVPLD